MNNELVLEKGKLKAISADTRIKIIKSLSKRRSTLSDLSKQLNLSKPTLKEHLLVLEDSGFVKKMNSNNIWKYYELTDDGRNLLSPSGVKVLFLSIVSFVIGAVFVIKYSLSHLGTEYMVKQSYSVNQEVLSETSSVVSSSNLLYNNYELIVAIFVFILAIVLLLVYLKNKKRKK